MDLTKLNKYIDDCKKELAKDHWLSEADNNNIGVHTIGYIAKMYVINCYLNDVPVKDCVKTLKTKIPGGGK